MKKIRIPFSLTEYEKGGYEVETREGKSVRILCTDRIEDYYPLVALIKYDDAEPIYSFSQNGERIIEEETNLDLFLVKQKFEDGDIIKFGYTGIGILKEIYNESSHSDYITLTEGNLDYIPDGWTNNNICLATEEEKQRLFDALAKDGKRWNAEKKCIEDIKSEDTFKIYDKVLVRNSDEEEWKISYFIYIDDCDNSRPFVTLNPYRYKYCVPYKNNENLLNINKE